jgi:hypothetical protein
VAVGVVALHPCPLYHAAGKSRMPGCIRFPLSQYIIIPLFSFVEPTVGTIPDIVPFAYKYITILTSSYRVSNNKKEHMYTSEYNSF